MMVLDPKVCYRCKTCKQVFLTVPDIRLHLFDEDHYTRLPEPGSDKKIQSLLSQEHSDKPDLAVGRSTQSHATNEKKTVARHRLDKPVTKSAKLATSSSESKESVTALEAESYRPQKSFPVLETDCNINEADNNQDTAKPNICENALTRGRRKVLQEVGDSSKPGSDLKHPESKPEDASSTADSNLKPTKRCLCKYCDESFPSPVQVWLHMREAHPTVCYPLRSQGRANRKRTRTKNDNDKVTAETESKPPTRSASPKKSPNKMEIKQQSGQCLIFPKDKEKVVQPVTAVLESQKSRNVKRSKGSLQQNVMKKTPPPTPSKRTPSKVQASKCRTPSPLPKANGSGENDRVCWVCGFVLQSVQNVKRHLKNMHDIDLTIKEIREKQSAGN